MKNKKPKSGQIILTKELFIETMERIKAQFDYDEKCHAAFSVILPNDFISGYDNSILMNQLLKLLRIAFNDDDKDSWIDYYIWELDFGTKYESSCGKNKDGTLIYLRNNDELYDFLINNI
jgi:hypothetical protein